MDIDYFTRFQVYFADMRDNLLSIIRMMTFIDFIDILILSFLVYKIINFVKETRGEQLLKGICILGALLLLMNQFEFKVLGELSKMFRSVGAMAVIVMFQPELRRVLEKMGRVSKNFTLEHVESSDHEHKLRNLIEQLSASCENLSRTATGALIVVERETKLAEYVDTGTLLCALPSTALFGNIFFPNTPMHDGAVIIRDGMVLAAGCFLPKPQNEEVIAKELGSRHRAAIGMSEVSDAIVIAVSEETGTVSVAENGVLTRGFNREKLYDLLQDRLGVLLRRQLQLQKSEKRELQKKRRRSMVRKAAGGKRLLKKDAAETANETENQS